MKKIGISIVIFYNRNKILLQDRRDFTTRRFGEEYGFFGGKLKENENPEDALKREIKEELNIDLKNFRFFKKYFQIFKEFNVIIERNIFIAPIPEIQCIKVNEGKPFITSFEKSFKLKMMPGDFDILNSIHNHLKGKKNKTYKINQENMEEPR